MTRRIIIFFALFGTIFLRAQADRTFLGIGAMGGVNSAYGDCGAMFQAVFYSHFDVNAGLAVRRYQGAGLSVGWRYYPVGIRYFSPFIAVNLSAINGKTFSVLHNNFFSIYQTPGNQYITSGAGLSYAIGQVDIIGQLNYSLARYEVHISNQSGFADQNFMQQVDRKINGGWGFTIGMIFRPWKTIFIRNSEFGQSE